LRDQLSAVDILHIEAPKGSDEAPLAVEIHNALLFDFSGGGSRLPEPQLVLSEAGRLGSPNKSPAKAGLLN
jgi:hypothetical protein